MRIEVLFRSIRKLGKEGTLQKLGKFQKDSCSVHQVELRNSEILNRFLFGEWKIVSGLFNNITYMKQYGN